MTTRIPSSLKWLVTKYQNTENELEATITNLNKLAEEKDRLYKLLHSLECVLKAHEISIDARDIPRKQRSDSSGKLKYGALTKSIYKFLSLPLNKNGASVTSVTDFAIGDLNVNITSNTDYLKFREKVIHRLKGMSREKKLERVVYGKAKKVDPIYKL